MYRNLCELSVGHRMCGCFFVPKVEIISLAFKWLIILRPAIKMCGKRHQVLRNMFVASYNV